VSFVIQWYRFMVGHCEAVELVINHDNNQFQGSRECRRKIEHDASVSMTVAVHVGERVTIKYSKNLRRVDVL